MKNITPGDNQSINEQFAREDIYNSLSNPEIEQYEMPVRGGTIKKHRGTMVSGERVWAIDV